jgi:hypothetical protein
MDVNQLIALRDALVRARASGVRTAEYGSGEGTKKVTYATDYEMTRALSDLERRIAVALNGQRATTIRFATSKGL